MSNGSDDKQQRFAQQSARRETATVQTWFAILTGGSYEAGQEAKALAALVPMAIQGLFLDINFLLRLRITATFIDL